MKAGGGRRTERLLASKLASCQSAPARLYTGHWKLLQTVFTKTNQLLSFLFDIFTQPNTAASQELLYIA